MGATPRTVGIRSKGSGAASVSTWVNRWLAHSVWPVVAAGYIFAQQMNTKEPVPKGTGKSPSLMGGLELCPGAAEGP